MEAEDHLPCPLRFIRMVRGDVDRAQEFWNQTVQWRQDTGVEAVLTQPQPHFDVIKREYPHFLFGRDKQGHPIYFDIINSPNKCFKALREQGVGVDDMVDHMIFLNEWMWRSLADDYDDVGTVPKKEGYLLKVTYCAI